MQIMVASNSPSRALSVQQLLLAQGHICPSECVVALDHAVNLAAKIRPEVVIVTLSPDAGAALDVLDELRETSQARLLGMGPTSDAQLILQTMRKGAYQYLDEDQIESELSAAIGKLVAEETSPSEPGKTITVLGPSGGCGSSTVAVNIATVLADEHSRCAMLDLNLENGDLATLLDVTPLHTVADFCENIARMDGEMFEQCLVKHKSGIHLLAAPRAFADARRVTSQGVRKAISMANRQFEYSVIDLDHSYGEEHVQALYQSDVIVIVLRLDIASLRQTQRTLDFLQHLEIADDRIRLVVNRYGRHNEVRVSQAQKTLGFKVRQLIPDDPKTLKRANLKGIPVVWARPNTAVSQNMVELARSVNGRVPQSL